MNDRAATALTIEVQAVPPAMGALVRADRELAKAALRRVVAEAEHAIKQLEAADAPPLAALPTFMRIEDYAAHREVSGRTIRRWIDLGLPVKRVGRTVRVVVRDADPWDEQSAVQRMAETDATRSMR